MPRGRKPIEDEFTGRLGKNGKPLSRQRLYQLRCAASGKCIICGAPSRKSSKYCLKHTVSDREQKARARGYRRRNLNASSYWAQKAVPIDKRQREIIEKIKAERTAESQNIDSVCDDSSPGSL